MILYPFLFEITKKANFIEKERLYCRYITTTTNFYLALLVETYFKC